MKVKNNLLDESIDYRNNTKSCDFYECVVLLDGIYQYLGCVKERLYFNEETIYFREIAEGISLSDWLWSDPCDSNEKRYIDLLLNILTKPTGKKDDLFDEEITICLFPYQDAVSSISKYMERRRSILSQKTDKNDFYNSMQSCFMDSVFSNHVKTGLNSIRDFNLCVNEIVENLSVLNDEAVDLYNENRLNLTVAYDILTSKLLECAPDPKHAKDLLFEFINDDLECEYIECSPHMKLRRRDSDLRIYFFWCHDNVGGGQKVLIGKIGTHPY